MAIQKSALEKYMIIIEYFNSKLDKKLTSYDSNLQEILGVAQKQLDRLLMELEGYFDNIVLQKDGKKKIFKLIKPIDVLVENFHNSQEIGWLFNMAHDGDPTIFKELDSMVKKDKDIYKFKTTPFEDISSIESKQTFQRLKRNIEAREYTKIKFYDEDEEDNLKCLKLVFIDNNWYVAYVDEENILKFGRISFISRVDYGSKTGHFQLNGVEKHKKFLENGVQNSMTLYGVEKKVATIKATPRISKYFEKNMKKFLSSQKFQKRLDDGSVVFTLEYTQPIEILPFIQKWLPDLIVLEPKELRDELKQKLKESLDYFS